MGPNAEGGTAEWDQILIIIASFARIISGQCPGTFRPGGWIGVVTANPNPALDSGGLAGTRRGVVNVNLGIYALVTQRADGCGCGVI